VLLLLYAILFVLGLVILISGKLALSRRKHLVGRNARIVGAAFMATPVLSIVSGMAVTLVAGSTSGLITSFVVLSIAVLAIAASLNRFATPIAPSSIDVSGLTACDTKAPDFSMLGGEPPKSGKV
jgi:hypothetical protein